MKKVIIEITDNGWTTTVQLGDNTYSSTHKATHTGARQVDGNIDEIDDDELIEQLEGFMQYSVMNALQNYLL